MSAIRVITAADIPAAMHLKDAAGWNQTETDWRNLFLMEPEGCFGIDVDGALAATTTAVKFGRELGWIGMVLTHPDHRGKGLARRLMEHALAYLDGRVGCVKLDATDMGRPLYLKLGFVDECLVQRWARPGAQGFKPGRTAGVLPRALEDFDRQAFGAVRSQLLAVLAKIESIAIEDGYAMARAGSKATYFGPCVARTSAAARGLIDTFLARRPDEAIYWDILPRNTEALRIAQETGFQPVRKLIRMVRPAGTQFRHDDGMVYAIAGFEYG